MQRPALLAAFHRGILYADSFLRLTNRQRYSIVVGKYLNDYLSSFSSPPPAPDAGGTKHPHSTKYDYPGRFKHGIKKAMRHPGTDVPIWGATDTSRNSARPYQQALNGRISAYVAGEISGLWDENEPDTETKCNYQRFYLFDVALADLPNWPTWAFKLINDWIDLNPPVRSTAWDSFNCAVRLLNWIKLLHDAPGEAFPDSEQWKKILHSIHLQLHRIRRGCRHEVPGNHVFIELFSLWLSASLFTDINEACEWQAFADKKLAAEIDAQFLASGFHCEHSVHYHAQVTLIALYWLCVKETQGTAAPDTLRQKVHQSCIQIGRFVLPDGSVALFGDGCYPFFHATVSQDIANILRLSSTLFPASGNTSANRAAITTSDIYPYIVSTCAADTLIADVGNIGLRNNPGHGHSDLLSFIYCSRGIPLTIDPGTRAYTNDPESLQLKRAGYHNTISVDNADHARLWGYFRWAFLPDDPSYAISSANSEFTLRAQYHGFMSVLIRTISALPLVGLTA